MKKLLIVIVMLLLFFNEVESSTKEVVKEREEVKKNTEEVVKEKNSDTKEIDSSINDENKEKKAKCDRKIPVINSLFSYKTKGLSKDMFHPVFLEAISLDKIKSLLEKMVKDYGFYEKPDCIDETNVKLYFSKAIVPCKLYLSSDNKIAGIWFGNGTFRKIDLNEIKSDFANLDGNYSVCVLKGTNEIVYDYNSNIPMAVGSAFKLYVLKAVLDKIKKEKKDLSEVVKISSKNKSNKQSQIYKFPDGSFVTLNTLANFMISVSDNSATDHLIDYASKKEIEKILPKSCKPFLSTKDFFDLKFSKDYEETAKKYIDGTLDEKYKILKEINDDTKEVTYTSLLKPKYIDKIEWLLSTFNLCKVAYELRDNEILAINPGILAKDSWDFVGYKGGSEPGVLNFTYILRNDKTYYSVSATINNKEKKVNMEKFVVTVKKLIDYLSNLK